MICVLPLSSLDSAPKEIGVALLTTGASMPRGCTDGQHVLLHNPLDSGGVGMSSTRGTPEDWLTVSLAPAPDPSPKVISHASGHTCRSPDRTLNCRTPNRCSPPPTAPKRTGVTIKALRVYERQGLIKPVRSASRWRLYGETELIRLNAISALKSLGLSLAQIRKTLDATPPELPQVLKMQLDAWRARRRRPARRSTS